MGPDRTGRSGAEIAALGQPVRRALDAALVDRGEFRAPDGRRSSHAPWRRERSSVSGTSRTRSKWSLAERHRDLVCAMNLELVTGVADGLLGTRPGLEPRLERAEGTGLLSPSDG